MRIMIDRDELIDAISGFGLFSDLSAPQLEAIIHIFDERMFAEGETIVHQGLSGSGFFVIVDGEARVEADGRELARLWRGDFFGEVAILLGVPAIADVIATRQMRCLVLPGPQRRVIPHQPSEGDVPHAPGAGAPAPGGEPLGDVTESARPFPPGAYPVVVIGSGPGGIQVSYALRRNGIEHAVISEDPSPGGMFRRWPHFQRLLSWTKPHAPVPRGVAGVRALRLEQPPRR